jgi:hypothetical protein
MGGTAGWRACGSLSGTGGRRNGSTSELPVKVEARKTPKKKPRVVLRKKVSVGQPMTLVDRASTHSLTSPRAVQRYLDAMTLQHALILADK